MSVLNKTIVSGVCTLKLVKRPYSGNIVSSRKLNPVPGRYIALPSSVPKSIDRNALGVCRSSECKELKGYIILEY